MEKGFLVPKFNFEFFGRHFCVFDGVTDSETCQGKFLQLVLHGQHTLLFSPGSRHRYHNQILARFLQDNAVAHRWITEERLDYDTSKLQVLGGGRFRVNRDARTLELWDDSHVYGRFDDHGLAERIARAGHAWSGYAVRIW